METGIPVFGVTSSMCQYGDILAGLYSTLPALGRFAAQKAEQILYNHTNIEDIPIENLSKFSLIVNMNAANRLKLYPPIYLIDIAQIRRK